MSRIFHGGKHLGVEKCIKFTHFTFQEIPHFKGYNAVGKRFTSFRVLKLKRSAKFQVKSSDHHLQ